MNPAASKYGSGSPRQEQEAMSELRLSEIAAMVGGVRHGEENPVISEALPLQDATRACITLVDHEKHLDRLHDSAAVAAIASQAYSSSRKPLVVVEDLHAAFVKIILHFRQPRQDEFDGVAPTAVVHPTATIGEGTVVGPGTTIGADVRIGSRCVIHPGCHLQVGSCIGDDTILFPNVTLYAETKVGSRVILHSGVVLGAHGFGFRQHNGVHQPTPQLGWVEIEDDVEIGAGTTIDRGTYGPTRIGAGTKIDNLVQIGHNCSIGRHNLICSHVGIAGSCRTGDYVVLAGQVGLADHVTIHDRAVIGARSGVMRDVGPGEVVLGAPALPIKQAMQVNALVAKLPELRRHVRELDRRQSLIEQALHGQNAARDAA
ncbi:MAG: UDP-3-O-(3-hydroxymyristoyl)glucosamine N-acyltransferase [Planctomycetota bacterium]|nr:MAG: UDP-3-O-(3-hydroxymyristoyl)glucosamine N-acyltransferase [Planctomycetota bacterium]